MWSLASLTALLCSHYSALETGGQQSEGVISFHDRAIIRDLRMV
jgi:hypothetical protein